MKPAASRMIRVAEYQQDVGEGTYEDRQKEAGLNEDENTLQKIFREKKLQVEHGVLAVSVISEERGLLAVALSSRKVGVAFASSAP